MAVSSNFTGYLGVAEYDLETPRNLRVSGLQLFNFANLEHTQPSTACAASQLMSHYNYGMHTHELASLFRANNLLSWDY